MAEQEQNRSEPATPFKLEEARTRGSVAKSTELNSFLIVAGILGVLSIGGPGIIHKQLGIERAMLATAAEFSFELPNVVAWLSIILMDTFAAMAPLLLVAVLVGALASVLQTGPIFSFYPIKPDFERINPAAGFKRLFSLRTLFEAIKSIVKLALLAAVAYFVLLDFVPRLVNLSQISPQAYAANFLELACELGFKLALVLMLVAVVDLAYVRWDYASNLMMSRRELKDEIKRREGDPRIKTRIKELQRELLKRSKSLSRVKDADVLITNPTHFAVALRYRRGEMVAPSVTAKGAGEMAEKMKWIAMRYRVPVFQSPKLARELFRKVDLEREIPERHYAEIARILAWAYTAKAATGGGGT
jgi:flagellar biosynthetic protein FlhB